MGPDQDPRHVKRVTLTDSGSQKVQQPFQRFQAQMKLISRSVECTPKTSSDLERAPGARSIGDEFS
eukprot:5863981-Prymnesium_polylepis.1